MRDGLLIYGAYGYSGRLIARAFAGAGLRPILAGRDAQKVQAMAGELDLPWVGLDLADAATLREALGGVAAVVHCAGPFSATSKPMVDACLQTRTHYLDITGEIDVFEACAARSKEALAAGIMLLPGCGFDVVPSDCLALHVTKRLPDASHLRISISLLTPASGGTLATGAKEIARPVRARRNGKIIELDALPRGTADFGNGPRPTVGVSWGDVATAFHSTHIPNIDVEFEATPQISQMTAIPRGVRKLLGSGLGQRLMQRYVKSIRARPDAEGNPDDGCLLLAEARNDRGDRVMSRLRTKGAYWLTAQTALLIARRVLAGAAPPGYQTPSSAYGERLIFEIAGSTIEDL